jgi:hypothetical protein
MPAPKREIGSSFTVGDRARILKDGRQAGKTCIVIDPNWDGRVKVQMDQEGAENMAAVREVKSYLPHELVLKKGDDELVLGADTAYSPGLAFIMGEHVRVIKDGSQIGKTAVVIDPKWGSDGVWRVKVLMDEESPNTPQSEREKSYLRKELVSTEVDDDDLAGLFEGAFKDLVASESSSKAYDDHLDLDSGEQVAETREGGAGGAGEDGDGGIAPAPPGSSIFARENSDDIMKYMEAALQEADVDIGVDGELDNSASFDFDALIESTSARAAWARASFLMRSAMRPVAIMNRLREDRVQVKSEDKALGEPEVKRRKTN